MEIVLATQNKDKIKEIREILKGISVKLITFQEHSRELSVKEDGKTLEENAIKKAEVWMKETGKPALADDSGLEVDYLTGAPGVYSSRFAGEDVTYADNNAKLLKIMNGVPEEKRTARFRCIAALVFPDGRKEVFQGIIEGIIITAPRGKSGFGYDPVFLVPEYNKTLAELRDEIKNKISHRAVAFKKVREYLSQDKKTTKIKVCGITNREDAFLALSLGVDAVGFIFAESKRRITAVEACKIIDALPQTILKVGVFVNEEEKRVRQILELCHLNMLQFHGEESPEYILKFREKTIKSFRIEDEDSLKNIPNYKASAYLLDTYSEETYGGTGKTFNWDLAVEAKKFGPIFLAGGLNLDNVEEAIRKVEPYAVDVSSGVESYPGKKDPKKLEEFVRRVRGISNAD